MPHSKKDPNIRFLSSLSRSKTTTSIHTRKLGSAIHSFIYIFMIYFNSYISLILMSCCCERTAISRFAQQTTGLHWIDTSATISNPESANIIIHAESNLFNFVECIKETGQFCEKRKFQHEGWIGIISRKQKKNGLVQFPQFRI